MKEIFDRLVNNRPAPEARDMPPPEDLIARGITTQSTLAHLAQRLPPAPAQQLTPGDKFGWMDALALHDECRMKLDSARQATFKQVSRDGRKAFNTAKRMSRQDRKEHGLTGFKQRSGYKGIGR